MSARAPRATRVARSPKEGCSCRVCRSVLSPRLDRDRRVHAGRVGCSGRRLRHHNRLDPRWWEHRVDGYALTLSGQPRAGQERELTLTISRDGTPVTDLQPYLDTYAHLTAIRDGDLAFAHLHPQGSLHGDHGGPTLTFHAEFPKPGDWRLFIQFQTSGTLHTAATTVHVS